MITGKVIQAFIGAVTEYVSPVAVLLVVLGALWLHQTRRRKHLKQAPGPKGTPVLGYLPFLGRNHHEMFLKLSRIYGPVVRIKIGTVDVIVLNDIGSIKEGFKQSALDNRLNNVFLEQTGYPGIGTLNGKAWKDNRRVSIRILHDLGFGKDCVYRIIQEEVAALTYSLQMLNQEPIFIRRYIVPSLSNVITSLLFNVRFPKEHETRVKLDQMFMKAGRALTTGSLVVFIPLWLNKLIGYLPFTRIRAIRISFGGLLGFIREMVEEHEQSLRPEHTRDFIDAYLKKCTECMADSKSTEISKKYLPGNLLSLFGAGTNAVSRNIVWHFLNFADKLDTVQKRIQVEIERAVGQDRQPVWNDHLNMPYTMAVIQEMHRWKPVTPLGLPRGASDDVEICGYHIPKGCIVMANFWALNMNPEFWNQPEEFIPERFLEDDGSTLVHKPEHHIPFSVGKRMCPAETFSTAEAFCYITGVLQKFQILPKEGTTIDLSMDCGTFNAAKMQEIRLMPRSFSERV